MLNVDAKQGLASLMMAAQSDNPWARQRVDVTPGETVTVWGWVRTDALTTTAYVELGSETVASFTGTMDYTYFERDVTVPAGVTSMNLMLYLQSAGTGTANFDYIHVE